MKYDLLYNFISPVTGRIKVGKDYILIGDKYGIGLPSPILIDIRQDIIDLRRKIGNFEELKKLDHNRIWIGDDTNAPIERLQIGIINLPSLSEALFPNPLSPIIGDFRIPNPTFDYLSPFDWVMSGPFLPQIYATKYDTLGNPVGTDVSSSLAMTQVRAAQIMKRFDNANFIVGSSTVEFSWENPKMYLIPEPLKQLYGLGTSYTFTKAQSLGALETGLLKNTVNNGSGTLSRAIAGKDYVDVSAPIANMQLALIRPLLEDQGQDISKLISRIDKVPIENLTNLTTGKIWQGVNNRPTEVTLSEAGIADKNATYILQTPDNNLPYSQALSSISGLLGGILKCNSLGVVSIASGGSTPLINDYVTPANLAEEKAERIGSDSAIETALVALEAEVEAEIAALAGVVALDILGTILGFIGVAVGGKAYGDYIRGQTLNVKNTWKAADLNDEGHNAVGDYEFRFPSGYSSDDRGHGTLWFDSTGRGSENKAEAGLRLFSWDSGGDHIGSDDPIAPLHIGLFGYQNKYHIWPFPNPTAKYKGFIFSIPDFHNESSSDNDYRFPKKFGLYDVTRTIGTWTSNKYGWDSKSTIFEYDYNNFSFYKNVKFNNYADFEETVDFQKDVKFLSKGAIKIPVGNTNERPSNSQVGMVRYNTEI
ncbi:hypothetical protein Megvenef_00341 [Candidatus Megaera venefica]|uniref:Uncharacterized protein n=1 Tax=Candidatus Megaera venefica TaxID=2055910 RepID=A0ABU5NB27_9RICK|nr:hypothetical protein [Candidatus Megaera venefica]MEA0970382.1 hypothetical protein [Candidatus Megaera venefica]